MLKYFDPINNRRILYLDIGKDLTEFEAIDLSNWVLYVIEDDAKNPVLFPFTSLCLKKNVIFVGVAGKACSIVHDIFDETIVGQEIDGLELPDWMVSEEDVLMTTWHHDFAEGFWFITSVADYDDLLIDTVLVANLTGADRSSEVAQLVIDINNGWLPEV
jgi:hypothetical protein